MQQSVAVHRTRSGPTRECKQLGPWGVQIRFLSGGFADFPAETETRLSSWVGSALQAESRDRAVVRLCLEAVERSLKGFEGRLEQRFDALESRVNGLDGKMERQLAELDQRLASISEAVGIKPKVSSGDDDEDRKRLKERFKEALDHQKKHSVSEIEAEGYAEYFFGICKPNGRLGKHGSRSLQVEGHRPTQPRGDERVCEGGSRREKGGL
jgi:hypothetical protein